MTFINYYDVLEIETSADPETIKQAVRRQRRDWRNRQAHPNLDTRATAEKMTKHISDAEAILGDSVKRSEYDRTLRAQVATPASPPDGGTSGRDWLVIARDYLGAGSASQANYAAREATSQQSENPDAWYVRGMSSAILGNRADAEFELGEAIRLKPNDPTYQCELGDLYMAAEQPARAQLAYQRASDLEPGNTYYRVGVATTLTAQDRPADAVAILKDIVKADPKNEFFKNHYAIALCETTTRQWSQFHDGTSSITNEAQLNLARTNLSLIRALNVTDTELKDHIDELKRVTDKSEQVRWYGSDNLLTYLGGFGASFVGMLIFFSISSTVFIGLICLVALVLIPVIFVSRHRMPGWKWDGKHVPAYVRKSGLQPSIGA